MQAFRWSLFFLVAIAVACQVLPAHEGARVKPGKQQTSFSSLCYSTVHHQLAEEVLGDDDDEVNEATSRTEPDLFVEGEQLIKQLLVVSHDRAPAIPIFLLHRSNLM